MTANSPTISPTLEKLNNAKINLACLQEDYRAEERGEAADAIMRAIGSEINQLEEFIEQVEKNPHIPVCRDGFQTVVQHFYAECDAVAKAAAKTKTVSDVVVLATRLHDVLRETATDKQRQNFDLRPCGWYTNAAKNPRQYAHEQNEKKARDAAEVAAVAIVRALVVICGGDPARMSAQPLRNRSAAGSFADCISSVVNRKDDSDAAAIAKAARYMSFACDYTRETLSNYAMHLDFPVIGEVAGVAIRFGYGKRANAVQFVSSNRAIFLDGALNIDDDNHEPLCDCYRASTKANDIKHMDFRHNKHGYRANFDHHQGCPRAATAATCEQVLIALATGMTSQFNKHGKPTLYINDMDADTAIASALIIHVVQGRPLTPAIADLVRKVGAVDTHGPAIASLVGGIPSIMRDLSFPPQATQQPHDEVMQKLQRALAVLQSDEACQAAAKPAAFTPRPASPSRCIVVDNDGNVIVTSASDFAEAYKLGDFIVLGDGGARVTVGKAGAFCASLCSVPALLQALNAAEMAKLATMNIASTSAHHWGGGDTIGGAPRTKDGSVLTNDEILEIVKTYAAKVYA